MTSFKVPGELGQIISNIIYEAQWYFTCDGYQNQHNSDLSLEEHYMENEDEVIAGIVQEVLDFYKMEKKK